MSQLLDPKSSFNRWRAIIGSSVLMFVVVVWIALDIQCPNNPFTMASVLEWGGKLLILACSIWALAVAVRQFNKSA